MILEYITRNQCELNTHQNEPNPIHSPSAEFHYEHDSLG